MQAALLYLVLFFTVILIPVSSFCGEVKGKVVQVRGNDVTIRLADTSPVAQGDRVELSYSVDDEVIGIGAWQVSVVNSDGTVQAVPVDPLVDPMPGFDAVVYATGRAVVKKQDEQKDSRHQDFLRVQEAAMKGDVEAQQQLAAWYETGYGGVEQSYSKSFEWYLKAAQQGDAAAQWTVGILLRDGKGVPKDLKESFKWSMMAANQKFSWAYSNVGFAYAWGQGVPENLVEAYKWYDIAVSAGGSDMRGAIAPLMTRQQIDEAKRLSMAWQRQK